MSNKENKINIGLDIGVNSVGWSIIDDDYNIIDMGVRLFDDPANNGNVDRRNARHLRRLYSRRKIRRKKLEKFLVDNHLVLDHVDFCNKINIDITKFDVDNPIELKCKALKQKVSNDELVYILFHYIYHRGYFYLTEEEEGENKKEVIDSKTNKLNDKDNLYPSIALFNFYKKNGYYKSAAEVDDKLLFSNQDWCKEIKQLLLKQECSDKFIKYYLDEIFSKTRKFNEGPGSLKSPTQYGLYIINPKSNVVEKIGQNLWDAKIGNCSYYNDKKENKKLNLGNKGKVSRSFKNSPITELFNLFNDISNIKFKTDPSQISVEMKDKIVEDINKNFPNKKYSFSLKKLVKFYNKFCKNCKAESELCEKDISGYRTKGKKNTFDFTCLNNYTIIAKYLLNNYDKLCDYEFFDDKGQKKLHSYKYKGECSITNMDLLEKCNLFFIDIAKNSCDFLSRHKWLQETQKLIEKEDPTQNEKIAQDLKGLTKSSSLSDIAMLKYIDYFIKLKSENGDCFYDNWTTFTFKNPPYGKDYSSNEEWRKYTYLRSNLMDNEIVSPTVRRSFNQACQIVNKIISIYCKKNKNKPNKKIYKINNITIELPRDKNINEERKKITKYQRENEAINKKAKSKGIPSEWLKLYELQNQIDLYDGKKIDLEKDNLQVDHIIPISISSDDSSANKVLTHVNNNQHKDQNTPWQWLTAIGKYEEYKQRVNDWWEKLSANKKYYQKKYNNLLLENDPLNNINEFINRNLVDTRYASRLVLNKFQDFFKCNDDYGKAKIKVVRGSVTSLCRNYLFYNKNKKIKILPKNRELYCNHAIDASLICFLGMNTIINSLIKSCEYSIKENKFKIDKDNKQLIDNDTGEIISIMDLYNKKTDERIYQFGNELAKYNDKIIFKNVTIKNDIGKEIEKKEYDFFPAEKIVHYSRKLQNKNNIQLSNLSIYSWRPNPNNKNSYQQITKLDLLDSKTDVEKLDKFFNPLNSEFKDYGNQLLIYHEDMKLYKLLQKIFNVYSITNNEDKTKENFKNPFIKYMKSEHKDISDPVPNYILLNNNQRVRKLRYVCNEYKNKNDFKGIFLENHNNKGVMDTLKPLSWRIYVNKKGKPIVVPINIHVLKWNHKLHHFDIDDNGKLKKVLEERYNVENKEIFVEIKKYSVLVEKNNDKNIFYVVGSSNENNLEVKPINCSCKYHKNIHDQEKYWSDSEKRKFITINELFKEYDSIQIDILGKIYNRINLLDHFKNLL